MGFALLTKKLHTLFSDDFISIFFLNATEIAQVFKNVHKVPQTSPKETKTKKGRLLNSSCLKF